MAIELKSVTANPQSPFVLKSGLFALGLLAFRYSESGVFSFFIFTGIFFLYALPFFHTRRYFGELLVLVAVAFSSIQAVPSGYVLVAALYFSFLFYILVALKNVFLINRFLWRHALNLGLIYSLCALFFSVEGPTIAEHVFYYFGILFLTHQTIHSRLPVFFITSLLIIELNWIIAFLPLDLINASSLVVISIHALSVLFKEESEEEKSSPKSALITLTAFIAVLLIVFLNTAWQLPTA